MEQREFIVEAEGAGQRIDRFLSGEDTGLSRSALQALVAEGHVLCNGKAPAKSLKLKAGDVILMEIPDARPIEAVPQEIPLDIVYEDAHLLVVNKPKGMVVHPAPGNPDGTLVNALLWHCKGSLSGIGGEIRPGIVHRIDKDTSGLLVVAKDDATHIGLSQQMAVHSVERAYNTIVYGGFAQDEGFVESNLGRSKTDRKKMAVYPSTEPHTKYAYTGYKVLERLGEFTMLECRLKTGRTHQIRVHMASIHHPVAGDPIYGPHNCITSLHGQCLHAKTLGFIHPITGEHLRFDSELPDYFTRFLTAPSAHRRKQRMSNSIENTLVLCDLDNLLLNAEGNLPQLHRDVLQLFASRGGKLTVYSQRSPKVVRSLLGGVRLSAPALVCGGILAYNFAEGSGTALCSFAGMEDSVLNVLPAAPGIGIAFQMRDGTTRVVRMSEALEAHLRQEWTSFVLSNAADVKGEEVLRILFYQDKKQVPLTALLEKTLGEATVTLRAERMAPDVVALLPGGVSGTAMLNAVCPPAGYSAEQLTVLADCTQMTELVQLAGNSVVPADAPAELRLAAKQTTLTDHDAGAAAELLYGMVRAAEKFA